MEAGRRKTDAEEALQKLAFDLGERVKELNCLYGISALVDESDISLKEVLQGTVELIPPAWQYPEITCARIVLEDQEFRTEDFEETSWTQICDIIVHGEQMGVLQVCYLEERSRSDEGPFLKEERTLLNAIAGRLGRIIERLRVEEELRKYHSHLEELVEARTAELVKTNEQLQREITERVRAEEALRESERRYRQLFEGIGDAVMVYSSQGKFLDCNEATFQRLGYSRKEFLRMRGADIVHPDFYLAMKDNQERIWAGETTVVESAHRCKDGRVIPVEVNARRIEYEGEPAILAVVRDITERVRAEEALRESEARYRILFEQANDAIHVGNENDEILDVNRRACEMFGYSREELLNMTVPDLQAPKVRGQVGSVIKTELARYGDTIFEALDIHRDGTRIPVEVSVAKVTGLEGELFISIVRDITERVRAEEAIQQRNRELAELNAIISTITSTLALEQVLQRIVEATLYFLPNAHGVTVQLLDEAGDLSTRAVSGNISASDQPMVFQPGEGVAGWALQERRLVNVFDVMVEPRFRPGAASPAYRSLLVAPLIAQEQVLGTLSVTATQVGAFNTGDEQSLQGLAGYAAIAVQNARLYEQTRRDAETKAVLLKEVNHRVNNNLAAIIGLLRLERGRTGVDNPVAYQAAMQDLISRIQGLVTVHRLLSDARWSPLCLSELARRVIGSALQALSPGKRVSVEVPPSPVRVKPKHANELALIISELTTNSVKYAWPARQTGRIAVCIDRQEDRVLFEFRDDGAGYPEEVLRLERRSVGWDLIQSIVGVGLGGEVTLRNDQGAVTIIRFPASV